MIKELTVNSILAGQSPTTYYAGEGQFDASISIDPDFPISSSNVRTSGYAVPIGMTDFSSSNLTSTPIAIITTPKNTNVYVVTRGGRLISYNSSLASETLIGTVTGSTASGAEYYNNYIYIFGTGASANDVSRYGPLDNSPSLSNGVWTSATLGSQTALTNTTYPSLRGIALPNHWGHVHGDNSLYFTDFKNGQGMIHKIRTTKTTNEGDTNDTSLYNALDLPFGFYPVDIESISTNLIIVGFYSPDSGGDIVQGKAAFCVWDPTNTTSFFLGPVMMEDPIATACKNVNGIVHIFTGNGESGVRLSRYLGGESTGDVVFQEDGLPPFPGAVDTIGNRIVWGGFTTYPEAAAVAWAYGSKDDRLPAGLHSVARSNSAGANQNVYSLKYVQQASNIQPKVILGWRDDSDQGIDKYSSSATLDAHLRFLFNPGAKCRVNEIEIPLAGAVDANTTIVATAHLDDFSSSVLLPAINNTNYPADRKIYYSPTDLNGTICENNFALTFNWTGTNPLPIAFPIRVWVDVYDV